MKLNTVALSLCLFAGFAMVSTTCLAASGSPPTATNAAASAELKKIAQEAKEKQKANNHQKK